MQAAEAGVLLAALDLLRLLPVRGSIFSDFSAHADGERRGLDRAGG